MIREVFAWFGIGRPHLRKINSRDHLSLEEIHLSFYEDKGVEFSSFKSIWNEISLCVKIHPGLMRPTDVLDGGLTYNPIVDSPEFEALFGYLESELPNQVKDVDVSSVRNLDDFLMLIVSHGNV